MQRRSNLLLMQCGTESGGYNMMKTNRKQLTPCLSALLNWARRNYLLILPFRLKKAWLAGQTFVLSFTN